MNSREQILERVRRGQPSTTDVPTDLESVVTFADVREQFLAMLAQVGGQGMVVADQAEADRFVRELPEVRDAKMIVSLVDGVVPSTIDINDCHEPHELAGVDVAIAQGRFAVAENAAVWVTDENLAHRAIYFICQHLVLVLPANEIINNMHEAYRRLKNAFQKRGFGSFISGPSKTADIEQSLVIGAQGPRSLTVVLVEKLVLQEF